ncbi:MAG: hypothetical protein A4E58_03038 [Syntrophorhabdus sp. PtaB.Bin006]|nr:MAG: hypothetical protein A4E58_03038 [Syntrophorhabdus sp. PtaB.Bin006]
MKRTFLFFFLILMTPFVALGATAQCPRYSVLIEGTTVNFGVTYTERLSAHKVGKGSGYNGRWQIDTFEQISVYPSAIPFAVPPTTDRHDLGNGVWMVSTCAVAGNVIRCATTTHNMAFEVINNKVRMEKTLPWHGKIEGSTMSWKFHLENPVEPTMTGIIAEGPREPIELSIVEPASGARYRFNYDNPGILRMSLVAKVVPAQYESDVAWSVPELEGSTMNPKPEALRGSQLDISYTKLPESYTAFGPKKVKATLKVGSCIAEDTRDIKVFYSRDGKNNPEGKFYNWFYYWKQTPPARPQGQLVNIEFGGTQFDQCKDFHVPALFKPAYMYKTIHICDLTAKLDNKFSVTVPKVNRTMPATLTTKQYVTTTHIDTFATIMLHEFVHFNAYHTWREGKSQAQMEADDQDWDGVPDHLEPSMDFKPDTLQTYWGQDPDWKRMGGDEEFLAYETASTYSIGKYDVYDWGFPGKNWP